MPNDNLVKYIRDGLAQGRTEDILRPLLLSSGWQQKDIDAAFSFVRTGVSNAPAAGGASINEVLVTPAVAQPTQPAAVPPKQFNAKLVGAAAFVVLLLVAGSALAYHLIGFAPSPQKVLDVAFQKGFTGISSENNVTSISLDVHVVPTSTAAAAGVNAYAGAILGGTPSELQVEFDSSGTLLFASGTESAADQFITISLSTKREGESQNYSMSGEFRIVGGVEYINISQFPNLGFINAVPFEGKWISLQSGSSMQGIGGVSTTVSAADMKKILNAMESMITITKTLPDATVGDVSSYHYQYAFNKVGVENVAVAFAEIAQESTKGASSTLDASTTASVTNAADAIFDVFTATGGELWIGKSDSFPHQASLNLSFATSTLFGAINGTATATTTNIDINAGQTVTAPANAVDFETLIQSAFSWSGAAGTSLSTTQSDGRDARRISDIHELQNALELYYNKCDRYPGGVVSAMCSSVNTRVSTFTGLSAALIGSGIGITTIPNDPSFGATYYYGTNSDGSQYILAARLEDVNNSVFLNYAPPSLAGMSANGLTSCKAPMYCLAL